MGTSQAGMALISVLLLLTAMLVMALAVQMMALLGFMTTRNQIAFAQSEAEMHSRLTHSLLILESQLTAPNELPESPVMPAGTSYTRLDEQHARLLIDDPEPPRLGMEVTVELTGGVTRVLMRR